MIIRPSDNQNSTRRVHLLCREITVIEPGSIVQELKKKGYDVHICTIHDPSPPSQDIIALLDSDGPFFEAINSVMFSSFKSFL